MLHKITKQYLKSFIMEKVVKMRLRCLEQAKVQLPLKPNGSILMYHMLKTSHTGHLSAQKNGRYMLQYQAFYFYLHYFMLSGFGVWQKGPNPKNRIKKRQNKQNTAQKTRSFSIRELLAANLHPGLMKTP